MSRFLLLIPFMIWMSVAAPAARGEASPLAELMPPAMSTSELAKNAAIFLGGYLVLVASMVVWTRLLVRRRAGMRWAYRWRIPLGRWTIPLALDIPAIVHSASRLAVPAWFAFGVYELGWRYIVGPMNGWPAQLPGMLVGVAPAMLAWLGLAWAQYPADRAAREQGYLACLEADLPILQPPPLRSYLISQLRVQVLFTIVPAILIIAMRDLVICAVMWSGIRVRNPEAIDGCALLISAATVFLMAPEILRRVLHTESLPHNALRRRLEAISQRLGVGYRDILLWRTDLNMGNAAVMGVLPRVRYILLSDLLLETMSDEQIEAVFAHEVGHIVHWHLAWFVVFFLTLFSMLAAIDSALPNRFDRSWIPVLGPAMLVVGFISLSRKFERQADVFAARTLERDKTLAVAARAGAPVPQPALREVMPLQTITIPSTAIATAPPPHTSGHTESHTYVGPYGADIFASALHRVAVVNNIPISGRNLTHGSIEKRMDYLRAISTDPAQTRRFDRHMFKVYAALLVLLSTFGVWAAVQVWRTGMQ